MNVWPCCGAIKHIGDVLQPHQHSCYVARTHGLPRRPLPRMLPVVKCTCGSGNPPLKGAGHSDWCDVEEAP